MLQTIPLQPFHPLLGVYVYTLRVTYGCFSRTVDNRLLLKSYFNDTFVVELMVGISLLLHIQNLTQIYVCLVLLQYNDLFEVQWV